MVAFQATIRLYCTILLAIVICGNVSMALKSSLNRINGSPDFAPCFGTAKGQLSETNTPSDFYAIKETGVRSQLSRTLSKRLETLHTYLEHEIRPQHTQEAFQEAVAFVNDFYKDFINNVCGNVEKLVVLDSGCGKGMSTEKLARMFPTMPVIGIDRSFHRLACSKYFRSSISNVQLESIKADGDDFDSDEEEQGVTNASLSADDTLQRPDNLLLVRADLSAFLSLACLESDWIVCEHYVLHPNPYPTPRSARYRLYELPSFPLLVALGGKLTCRSMWRTYLEELQLALQVHRHAFQISPPSTNPNPYPLLYTGGEPMTHFEKKYMDAQVPVYEVVADLGRRGKLERRMLVDSLRRIR